MFDDMMVYLACGLLIAGGIGALCHSTFAERFDRSLFHWQYIPIYGALVLGLGGSWLGWVSLVALGVLLFVHAKRYGVGWAICAAGLTFLICVTVVVVIQKILDYFDRNKRKSITTTSSGGMGCPIRALKYKRHL